MDIEKAFGTVLSKRRKNQKITQEKLANLCKLDRTYISMLERGLKQPTLGTIFKISNVLDLTPSEMLKEVEETIKNS